MTIEIHKPELEALIMERMKIGGFQNVEDVIMQALEMWPPMEAPSDTLNSGEEKAKAFVQWAKGHRDTPPLSDDSISRANLNPDRW